ncbi:hypothetical protein RchiOBHm_Chr1g0317771 [Rosa chinensis]|uniref:Uncharacterized protein n=1 Tax=Rosa chinensis TaxID=74649 RepID=A0A2P6S812_ROSCH|nr:hypothetical protein RchiOBHm_Chr1g0317771 [Rosa chinensis]
MDKYDGRVSMSAESMSRIEALFEAELERLGLNRSTSTLERRLTDLDEIPSLNQFLRAICHAHLRSETMLLLHHQSFDFSQF